MKARTLTRLLRTNDHLLDGFERRLQDKFEEVLAEVAAGAGDRFAAAAGHQEAVVLAAAPSPTSAMIACYPSDEQQALLARGGTEPPEEIHCTLAFLGEVEPDQAEAVAAVVQKVAAEMRPLQGEVGGVAAFGDNGDGHPSILLPDVVGLAELRHAVVTALEEAGIPFATNHGWTPHLTLGYTAEPSPPTHRMIGQPLDFAELSLAVGDRRRDYALAPMVAASGALCAPLTPFYGPVGLTAGAVVAESEKGLEIGEVAARHAPEGGYGDTAWNEATGTVWWTEADWSTDEEIDAALADFMAIDGVEAVEYEAEAALPEGEEWEVVYSSSALTAAAKPPPWMRPHPDELVDVDALIDRFRGKTDRIRQEVVAAIAEPALAKAGLSFDATNPFVAAVLAKTGSQVTLVADTTRLNVMRIVRRAYEEGLSIPDTAKAIQEGMLAASPARATLIARTEMVGLVQGGSLAATRIVDEAVSGDGQGGAYQKSWLTAPGANFPRHELYEGLDGQTVPLEAFFDLEGDQLQYPGDPDGSAENVCNCRCTLIYLDAAGGETDSEESAVAAALPSDETEGGAIPVSGLAGVSKKPTVETPVEAEIEVDTTAPTAPNTTEQISYALGWPNRNDVAPAPDGRGGIPGFGNVSSVFVRIRPEIDEAEIEQAATDAADLFKTKFRGELSPAELAAVDAVQVPPPTDIRPERTEGAALEEPAAGPLARASQVAWEAVLMPEGKLTDDGRIFAPGSVSWRELPLSLMAMTVTSEGGHVGAELAGRITRIWRDEASVPALIRAEGVFDDNEYGAEIARLVGDQTLRGNSVDTAIREVEFGPRDLYVDENGLWKDDAPAAGEGLDPIEMLLGEEADVIMVARDAVIGMSTVCPFPAFEDAGILLAAGDLPDFAIASDATGFRWRIWLKDAVTPAADVLTASAAGLAPLEPPAAWFNDPAFEELTGLTIDDEGRVFGHAAAWGVCHIGLPGACTTAPESVTDYAYFHLKEVGVEGGDRVACGTITLGTGHAGKTLSRAAAAEHYDHTGTAVADVRVGEDDFGIWVAGALRPELPAGRVRELRGSSLSGDWRKVEGNLELVGLLAVNVPGFPVPRPRALVAAAEDGVEVLSLTAAGIYAPTEAITALDRAKLAALAARAEGGLAGLADLAAANHPPAAPESLREALLAAAGGQTPAEPVQTSYELTNGSLTERRFLSEVIAAGFRETRRSSWPSEATLGEHGEVIERGDGDAVFRIGDTLVYAAIGHGWAYVRVAAAAPETSEEVLAAFTAAYPPLYRTESESLTVPITFWTLGQFGPQSRLRMIDSASWDDVAGNYSAEVKGELERLMSPEFEPGENGQLLLWQGEPGTGKTWALRALASQWADWAEFAYITDPDAFFVRDPSYMIDVLLHESYETLTVEGDVVTDSDPQGKWRILILEDTGELLSANAKEAYGQGLSRLLNVVDGMVGQGLRVLALLTTNDELGDLHPAAIRPGRCASRIEFGPLSAEEATAWLGEDVDAPATLAELYERKGGATAALTAEPDEAVEAEA